MVYILQYLKKKYTHKGKLFHVLSAKRLITQLSMVHKRYQCELLIKIDQNYVHNRQSAANNYIAKENPEVNKVNGR